MLTQFCSRLSNFLTQRHLSEFMTSPRYMPNSIKRTFIKFRAGGLSWLPGRPSHCSKWATGWCLQKCSIPGRRKWGITSLKRPSETHIRYFLERYSDGKVKLYTHHLVPWFRVSEAVFPHQQTPPWRTHGQFHIYTFTGHYSNAFDKIQFWFVSVQLPQKLKQQSTHRRRNVHYTSTQFSPLAMFAVPAGTT